MTTKAKEREQEQAEEQEQEHLEKLVQADEEKERPALLMELWEALDEQMRNWRHDEPNYRVRDVLRRLGPFPKKEEEQAPAEKEEAGSES